MIIFKSILIFIFLCIFFKYFCLFKVRCLVLNIYFFLKYGCCCENVFDSRCILFWFLIWFLVSFKKVKGINKEKKKFIIICKIFISNIIIVIIVIKGLKFYEILWKKWIVFCFSYKRIFGLVLNYVKIYMFIYLKNRCLLLIVGVFGVFYLYL